MRILVLHSELGVLRGGGENFTRHLFAALARRGHSISAAFVADRNGYYAFELPMGVEPIPIRGSWSRQRGQATLTAVGRIVRRVGWASRHWHGVQEAVSWRVIRRHNERFRDRVEQEFASRWGDFDLGFVHGDALLAERVARRLPTVLRLPGPVTRDLESVLRRVHVVCANGDALARIRSFLGEHARELPIGIDGDRFRPGSSAVRQMVGWTDQHIVFGYVGRLTLLKGVDLLVSAFQSIRAHLPHARLLIVGSGDMSGGIRTRLAAELADNVVHIEPDLGHEHLADWYRAMDLFVLPSRYENFSNAVLEAVSCGVPVIASDVGGNRSLAAQAGFLFLAGSAPALAEGLRTAAGRRFEMKQTAEHLSSRVRAQYDWSGSARCLESLAVRHAAVPPPDSIGSERGMTAFAPVGRG